jgi:hypothetical protein
VVLRAVLRIRFIPSVGPALRQLLIGEERLDLTVRSQPGGPVVEEIFHVGLFLIQALPRTTPKPLATKTDATGLSRATDLATGQVLLPGVIRDCMHASEVLEILSQVARGTHPKQQGIKDEASLRFSLDAIGQLVKVLGIEPPEKTGIDDPIAAKSRLRARLSKLPPAVLDQLREAVGDEEVL